MAAINKYVDSDLSTIPPITGGGSNSNTGGVPKRRSLVSSANVSSLPYYCQSIGKGKSKKPCGIMINIMTRSDGSKYAVLKLNTFVIDFMSDLLPAWSTLIQWAEGNKTDSLVIDLLGNGGGSVNTAYAFVVSLFNPAPDTTYPFFNQYDRRVGPAGQFFLKDGFYLSNIQSTLESLAANKTWIQERIVALNSNSSIVPSLINDTTRVIQAVDILISENVRATPCFPLNSKSEMYCARLWNSAILPQLIDRLGSFKNATAVDETALYNFISALSDAAVQFLPFSQNAPLSSDGVSGSLYNASTFRTVRRGGVDGTYTSPYYLETFQSFLGQTYNKSTLPQSPFKQVIAITDGSCGSSCDKFSRTSWLAAQNKATPTAPSFKYYTIGGTGNAEDISPTSFPGGNIYGGPIVSPSGDDLGPGGDPLSPAWAFYGLARETATWLGDLSILSLIDKIPDVLPFYPAFASGDGLPEITESEIYYSGLSPGSNPQSNLPGEYLLFKPDYYDPSFYIDTGFATLDNPHGGSDLPDLYEAVSQKFVA
jgi:hypothetical protein